MPPSFRRLQVLIVALVVFGGLLPPLLYAATLGSVPTVLAEDAITLLTGPEASAVLVDVRSADAFARRHVVGAYSWPLEQVEVLTSPDQLPLALQGKTLLVMCETGLTSVDAVRHLRAIGVERVTNVRGGLQEWVAAIKRMDPSPGTAFVTLAGEPAARSMSLFEQWAAVIAAFVFKPLYMALSLLLAVALWRVRAPDLVALKWSMLAFFVGEAWCAVNYIIFDYGSYLSEFLHGYGMVVAFGFAVYAVIEGLDSRVIRLSVWGQRCAALEFCGPCIKNEDIDCGARRLLMLFIPVASALALVPPLTQLSPVSYNTVIVGAPYNYSHPVVYQLFERLYCPAVALILFVAAFVIVWRQPRRPIFPFVWALLAAGLGALAFSFFRLLLGMVYAENLIWSTFWEEATELMFLIAAWGLVLLFRNTLLVGVTGFPWTIAGRFLQLPPPAEPVSPASVPLPADASPVVFVACEVLRDLVTQNLPHGADGGVLFLDYGLHRYPRRLREAIQETLDGLEQPSLVVLGYGLCGNGLQGVRAGRHTLLVPRVDDCIPLVLGSREAYRRQTRIEPATFYLSKGWLESGSHPLNEYQEYMERYGPANAELILDTQYRHCRRLAFVAHGQDDLDTYREQAQEVARFCRRWRMRYEEILGDGTYIRRLVNISRDLSKADDDFLVIPPGGVIESQSFLGPSGEAI